MEENNAAVAEVAAPKKKKSGGFKEWLRKSIVSLKRKTQNIPLVIILIASIIYLCCLNTLSPFVQKNSGINGLGIFEFVNTLGSILVLLLFLYSFPKNKKVNYIFVGITFAVLALMMVMDILFYVNVMDAASKSRLGVDGFLATENCIESLNCCIVHIIFLGISIVAFATLPLYKKLICKINTSKEIASNEIKEEIDTSEEDG